MSTATLSRVLPYEYRLVDDPEWALSEGSRHFNERSDVHQTLRNVTRRLTELGIPYAVAGGMALFRHGFHRFTEDVDILVTKDGLRRIHEELEGRGYLPVFSGSKNLRDTSTGVRIEFLISGQFPGDGKPKPVAFPEPGPVAVDLGGIAYLSLPTLIELKLASGLTNPDRVKDLGDVQELIKLLGLRSDFEEQLHPFVRGKFRELWQPALERSQRYYRIWRSADLLAGVMSIEGAVHNLHAAFDELEEMRRDGVTLDAAGGIGDTVRLMTTDPDVARKYDMHEESEFLGLDEPDVPQNEDDADVR